VNRKNGVRPDRRQRGATLVEALVVLGVLGLAVGATALALRPLQSPIDTGTTLLEGFLRQARLNAIATTSAYRVSPSSTSRLRTTYASSCSATTWTTDADMTLALPSGVTMTSTSWSVCFSSRGISNANTLVTLQHPTNGSRKVEVLVGGTTRIVP
jgi:Tfp pilus assembly protein FimT